VVSALHSSWKDEYVLYIAVSYTKLCFYPPKKRSAKNLLSFVWFYVCASEITSATCGLCMLLNLKSVPPYEGINCTVNCKEITDPNDLSTYNYRAELSVQIGDSNLCPPDQELGDLTKELASQPGV
jgi:hypothetical protein